MEKTSKSHKEIKVLNYLPWKCTSNSFNLRSWCINYVANYWKATLYQKGTQHFTCKKTREWKIYPFYPTIATRIERLLGKAQHCIYIHHIRDMGCFFKWFLCHLIDILKFKQVIKLMLCNIVVTVSSLQRGV